MTGLFCIFCGTKSESGYCKKCNKPIPTDLYSYEPSPYFATRYPKAVSRVAQRSEPFSYMEHIIKRITSTAISKQKNADVTFKAKVDDDVENIIVSFIPNSNFRTKGNIEVLVNGAFHMGVNPPDLTDVSAFDMHSPDVHDILDKGKVIEIRIWNSVDATSISITVGLTVGQYVK